MIDYEKFQYRGIDRPRSNYLYQIKKQVMIIQINCDVIASPLDYDETIDWYCKEYGIEEEDRKYLDIKFLDITKECIPDLITDEHKDYETLSYLFYLDDFVELIRGDRNSKEKNVTIFEGELLEYITIEEYCNRVLECKKTLDGPKIIASTEV